MRQTSLASWGLLGVLICTSIVSRSLAEEEDHPKHICNTTECIRKSNTVNRQVNRKIKPCKDYFGYVCGNWRGLREEVSREVKAKALKDLELLLNHSRYERGQRVAQKFVGAYKTCVREGNSTADIHALTQILRGFGITDWPVNEAKQKTISAVLEKSGLQPLFKYDVLKSKTPGGAGEIHLGAPTDFYVWPADYSEYPEYDYGDSISAAYETLIKEVIKKFKPLLPDEQIKEIAEKILDVETKLQKLAYESTDETKEMKIHDFPEYTSIPKKQFPLLKILNKDFFEARVPLFENDTIFLRNKTYYTSVMKWLTDNPSLTWVVNYIGWVHIRDLLDVTSSDLKESKLKYDTAIPLGNLFTREPRSKPEVCLELLVESGLMYGAASKFYITKMFSNTDRKRVEEVAEHVKSALQILVKNTDWMDKTTKTRALSRISNMTLIIGFQDYYLNETYLKNLYEFVGDLRPGNAFLRIYFKLTRNNNFQRIRTVRSEYPLVDLEEYGPLRSHALYNEKDDIFVYPAAALLTHYAGYGLPEFINYASLGANTARGMSNAFDKTDRINGKDVEFWSNETTTQYCKNDIRRQLQDTFCDDAKEKNNSHAVAFADHVAARAAFQAYQKASKRSDELLPKLPKEENVEKQFFLFFANAYCPFSVYQKNGTENATVYKDGLDILLTNYTEFKTAYNCPPRKQALKY